MRNFNEENVKAVGKPDVISSQFTNTAWDALVDSAFLKIMELSKLKGGEYAGDDDRLNNFRRNARDLDTNMETVWRVYAAKHWDAIGQFIRDKNNGVQRGRLEPLQGRVDDLLVYLLLFKAMLVEQGVD